MEVLQIIEEIEDIIEKNFSIMGYSFVNKEELMSMMDEVRLKLPDELKQARWVKEERQRILNEAQKESESIINNAKEKIISMIDEHEITKSAKQKADSIMEEARESDRNIRIKALMYADELLERVEKGAVSVVQDIIDEVRESRNDLNNSKK